MNKERFHNALALALGYGRILNDKRYKIIVDDNADDPKVVIEDVNGNILLSFNASETEVIKRNASFMNKYTTIPFGINDIIDAVNQAYIQATKSQF